MESTKTDKKATGTLDAARSAWEAGRTVFTPMLRYQKAAMTQKSADRTDDLAALVEAILAIGWRLDTWTASDSFGAPPLAFPLFVRPGADIR